MMAIMRRDGLAQLRQAGHRRILVGAREQGVGRDPADILRSVAVRESLAEIDRVMLPRKQRHLLEHGGRQAGIDRVHRRVRDMPGYVAPPSPACQTSGETG
jgi:hypothetical protein